MTRLFMTADTVGGVWQYALELAAALVPSGYQTTLALLGPPPSDGQRVVARRVPGLRLIETGLPLDWLASSAAEVRASARSVAALAQAEHADLIQLNQPAFASVRMPAPTIVVVHSCVATWWRAAGKGNLSAEFAWQTALVQQGLERADRIVCPSAAFADDIAAVYALNERPLVVTNGRTARLAGSGAMHDVVLTAGRLWDKGKNVATLDRAASRISVPFKAAGALRGPNGSAITLQAIQALGVLDEDALADWYATRPIFVSAARYEPFGLAVLEAAQAGCALVLSDIPTFRELWEEAALFVAPNDADGFASAIDRLIGDPALRSRSGQLAKRRASRFTPAANASGMAQVYATLERRAAA